MTAAGVLPRAAHTLAAGRQAHAARLCGPPFARGTTGVRGGQVRCACVKNLLCPPPLRAGRPRPRRTNL